MTNYEIRNRPPLILVVDDERALRLVLHRAMEKQGYQVTQAYNGQDCLNICQHQLPDLILLDAMMPGMDGFSCCKQMQTLLGHNCPPILMITALDDQESVDRAFEVGATDYITKPIDWSILTGRINRLLMSRWARAELQQKIQRECLLTALVEASTRELQRLSSVDSLTQLANRYYFDEYLQRELNRLQKYQLSLSLILVSINFVKEEYNCQPPDKYLSQIADTISNCKRRASDLIARFSDLEFAIIYPNTQSNEALQMAEKIISDLNNLNVADDSNIGKFFSCNLGLTSVIPNSVLAAQQLISTTKQALAQAKLSASNYIII